MPFLDLSIRTKLAAWATVGVLLVAGMLVNQQFGENCAARQRAEADNMQLAAIEALRAADQLRTMQVETSGDSPRHRAERRRSGHGAA